MTVLHFDRLRELLIDAAWNLHGLKGRTALALLGIAIGTTAVIAMLHIGHNARLEAIRQFEAMGLDLAAIVPRVSGGLSERAVRSLTEKVGGVIVIAPLMRTGGTVRVGRRTVGVEVLAVDETAYSVSKAVIERGRPTSNLDGFAPFAVVGSGAAAEIAAIHGRPLAIGDELTLNRQIVSVVGILSDSAPNLVLGIDLNRSVIVPFAAARRFAQPKIDAVLARLAPGADDAAVARAIEDFLASTTRSQGAVVQTARQMIAGVEQQLRIYGLLLLAIGAISLAVGGIGIMNVMLMNVVERRQEIGLRRALGARRADIRVMFVAEALILSACGTVAGIFLGFLVGWIFARSSGWSFSPAPLAVPLGVAMAITVGVFFGGYPAARAARLDPVTALRSA
jgi:putative ABC transport system permease protein